MAQKLQVVITGDTKDLNRALDKATKGTSKFHKGVSVAAIGAAGALAGLGLAAKVGFAEFNQGQKVAAQTEAVIRSTGGAAKVSAGHVDTLANSLLQKSGVDDEVIKSGENVLLTFTNVHNEAGRGGAIFDRATKAALDFSVATGRDMTSASRLLGRALNDPVKGMSALTRVGITFTEQQKKGIKAMVDHGHAADAQKIILGELEKKFGGSAAAAGDTFAGRMKVATENMKNFAGELIGSLTPALDVLSGLLSSVAGFMREHETIAKLVAIAVAGFAFAILALKAAMIVGTAVTEAMTAAQWLFNIALDANPIGIVVLALAALGAAFIIAWNKSETFRDIVTGVWDAVKDGVDAFVGFFTTTLPHAFQSVKDWLSAHWPEIVTLLSGPFAPVVALATGAFGIRDALLGALHGLVGGVQTAASAISEAIVTGIKAVVWDFPGLLYTRIIQPAINLVADVVQKAQDLSAAVPRGISAVVWGLVDIFHDRIINPLTNLVASAMDKGGDIARGIRDGIISGIRAGGAAVANVFIDFINTIIGVVNKLPFVDIGKIQHIAAAEGAVVRGPTVALVGEAGPEVIIPLSKPRQARGLMTIAARALGWSGDGMPAFAAGGIVLPPGMGNTWVDQQVAFMKGVQSPNALDRIAQAVAHGLAFFIDALPNPPDFPGDSFGIASGFAQGAKDAAADTIRNLWSRKDEWSPDKIKKAWDWANSQMGKPYIWASGHGAFSPDLPGYDCSGFASEAAHIAGSSISSPGTTMSLFPIGHPGSDAVTWGFRHMEQSNPRLQHMGIRILGDWFQFGDPGHKGGSDSDWSSGLRIPPGLPGYAGGGLVPRTGPAMLHRGETVIPANARGVNVNVTVVDQTFAGMSREQARRVADQLRPELARLVTLG